MTTREALFWGIYSVVCIFLAVGAIKFNPHAAVAAGIATLLIGGSIYLTECKQ